MRVITHDATTAAITLSDLPTPTPGPGEVLIRVAYAGVNRPDLLQRKGLYPPPAGATPILGLEVSGVIAALGPDVTDWRVGQAVCALTPGGGYAEYVTTPAGHCAVIPDGLGACEAAAIPETYMTVWANLVERARLTRDDTVLIHGGSSGIGITAIHIAKFLGARVFTTVGNDEKAAACKALGADAAINYTTQDWAAEIKAHTQGQGVNVILDMVGGPYLEKNIRSLAVEGRLVQIAFLQGSKVEMDWMPLMMKRLTFTGSTLRARPVEEKTRLLRSLEQAIWPALAQGRLRPVIHSVFPLERVGEAHDLMETSRHIGKIMLKVCDESLPC